MNEFIVSFILGLICTASTFTISLIIVLGAKSLLKHLSRLAPAKPVATCQKDKEIKPKPPRAPKTPQVVRSIEIDPSTVDRIYVKKSS
ncbi:MAG: hypothetical protein E7347_02740 [Clostridiales bacterium]|nr:hypothetical protein [Clostridiales bacterium]